MIDRGGNNDIGFLGALFLLLLALKLTHVIAWSWWWVTAPLWGVIAIVAVVLAVGYAGLGLLMLVGYCRDELVALIRRRRARRLGS